MNLRTYGDPNLPVMVCVPGLLGGAEDFSSYIEELLPYYHVAIFDPNQDRRQFGLSGLTHEVMKEIQFDYTANEIAQQIRQISDKPVYMCGISLGGKIVYDFVHKFPEMFQGGIITDVGPGSFGDSTLFKFVETTVEAINLDQEWPALKMELKNRIPENHLRSLVQSQLFYPTKSPPAAWRVGMKSFGELLHRQALDNQFEPLRQLSSDLVKQNKFIHVLKADIYSAIDEITFEQMKAMSCIKFHYVANASHFLHISHRKQVLEVVISARQ